MTPARCGFDFSGVVRAVPMSCCGSSPPRQETIAGGVVPSGATLRRCCGRAIGWGDCGFRAGRLALGSVLSRSA